MATRKPRAPKTEDAPVAEAEEPEATTPSDEEVQAAVEAAIAENQAKYAQANAGNRVSVTELYDQFTELVLTHVRGSRVHTKQFRTEQSAIRILELALGWAMQNRDVGPSIPMQEIGGTDELVGPEPHEFIGESPEPTTTEEAA